MAKKEKSDVPAAKRAPRKKKKGETIVATTAGLPPVARTHLERLLAGEHSSPHSVRVAYPANVGGEPGVIIRTLIPNAARGELLLSDGRVVQLEREAQGISDLYGAFVPGAVLPLDY